VELRLDSRCVLLCFYCQVRRKAKENNFKAVLETIRDLMNTAYVGKAVPPWLHDVFLG
jgi:intron-binding protein aquarius